MPKAPAYLCLALAFTLVLPPVACCAQSPAPPAAATAPAAKPAPPAPGPALTPAQATAEEDAARSLFQSVFDTKPDKMPPADLLTNRSAAMLGEIIFELFGGMTQLVSSLSKIGPSSSNTTASTQYKELDQSLHAIAVKYGLNRNKPIDDGRLEKNGRAFYADISALLTKLSKEAPAGSQPPSGSMTPHLSRNLADYTFTPVSPTEVKIATKSEPANMPLSARLEDGKWRLDFGGMDDLQKPGGSAGAAKP